MTALDRAYFAVHHPSRKRCGNNYIRGLVAACHCRMYEVAGQLGIGESTLYRWLRWELSEMQHVLIMEALGQLVVAKGGSEDDFFEAVASVPRGGPVD